jgi:hypothetical protein
MIATIPKNSREEIRVSLDAFQGQTLCNVRVWFLDGAAMRPGKQGIAVKPALLPDLIAALQDAHTRAAGGAA